MYPVMSARPEHRGSASRALAGFSVPHLLASGGREGSLVGNIYLEIQRGGAATSRGRLCVIEGDQYYLAAFYRAVMQMLGKDTNKADGLWELPGLDCAWL